MYIKTYHPEKEVISTKSLKKMNEIPEVNGKCNVKFINKKINFQGFYNNPHSIKSSIDE